jgi:small subunit ribosomal protein S6
VSTTQTEVLRFYESVIIMDPQATEAEQKALFTKNQQIIESTGGKMNHADTWGTRHLANPIGKIARGIFFHTTFSSSPKAIAELERTMGINEKVLRFMHTKLDERIPLSKHLDQYRETLAGSVQRLEEKDARARARSRGPGGDRPQRFGGEGRASQDNYRNSDNPRPPSDQ